MAKTSDKVVSTYDYLYRLVLIGDSGVGKTALLLRYSDNLFNASFISTIGIDFRIKTIEVKGKRIKLQIWDTAGQEQFHSVATSYYRNAHGIILLYDITSAESFIHVTKWVNSISKNAPTGVKQLLIGNKCDMEDNRRVIERDRGQALAEELDMPFLETSAKLNYNIEAAFNLISMIIMEDNLEKQQEKLNDVVQLTPVPGNSKAKHKCCNQSTA